MTSRTLVVSLTAAAGFAVLFANDNLLSTQQTNLIAQADARVGRPLTPGSVAGVARRTDRRAYRRGAVAAGAAVGAGAYYGASAYYGAGPYGTAGMERRAIRRAYYASGGGYYPAYGAGSYYGTGSYYGAGLYGTAGMERRAIRRAYYANGGYYSSDGAYASDAYASADNGAYDAYASANYGTGDDTYVLHGAYISGADAVRYCARTFRSYDIGSRTFLAYSGERVSCPQ
jgi:BA14K-like protein